MKNYFSELGILDNLSKKAEKELKEQEINFFLNLNDIMYQNKDKMSIVFSHVIKNFIFFNKILNFEKL